MRVARGPGCGWRGTNKKVQRLVPAQGLRRRDLLGALCAAGLVGSGVARAQSPHSAPALLVENVTRLYPVRVAKVVAPVTLQDVVQALQRWPGPVAIGGARYSMGGQIAVEGGLHIDMRGLNALVWLDPQRRTARVQAGHALA